ncbi:hypothetical protein E3N88_29406 [Mikania micrantha]|uniref:Uncharacterized protein n=1 Tax=Mikania micrantha TaxID=192012 RepID=A0A5N6MJ49_9ASTR|nr:hypothetical protein E3N88_29406 [Mikania micrantha]
MRTKKDARRLPAGFVDDTSKINARDPTFFFSRRKPVEDDEPGSESNGAELPETTPDTRQEMNVGMISEDMPTKRDLTDTSNESDNDFVRAIYCDTYLLRDNFGIGTLNNCTMVSN